MASTTTADRCTWWTAETVAVVTGGNKGIGFEIVRKFALEGMTVVLAARDENRGVKATEELHATGLKNVVFHKLDIGSSESVTEFADWIIHTYGGLDILVNNAAMQHLDNMPEHAKESIDINYYGTINLTEKLLPAFKASPAGARIVHLSSRSGWLASMPDEGLRPQLMDPSEFDQDTINNMTKKYLEACYASSADGYGNLYSFSKVLVNAYTRLLAQRVTDRPEVEKIYLNCADPGTVDTGMFQKFRDSIDDATYAQLQEQGHMGPMPNTTEDGADTPTWLAMLPPAGPSGRFWSDRKEFNYFFGEA